jgi:hypothetical protein
MSDTKASLVLATAATLVGFAATTTPLVGACGTAHYFLTYALVAEVRSTAPWLQQLVRRDVGLVVVNLAIWALPTLWLHLKRQSLAPRYVHWLIAWTALFLTSYFVLFPTKDCP